MPIRGKNPSTGRYRRDFYGKNRKDRDHSRNRRDFYGRNKSDIDHSRYRRDFFGHDLGDKRRENARRPHERPWRQTVGPGAPPTRASERRRKKREERQKKRDARRKRRRDRVAAKLPGNRRNPGFGGGGNFGLNPNMPNDLKTGPGSYSRSFRRPINTGSNVWDMDPIPTRGRRTSSPYRRPPIGGGRTGRYGRYGGGNRDMDPIPTRGRMGVRAGDDFGQWQRGSNPHGVGRVPIGSGGRDPVSGRGSQFGGGATTGGVWAGDRSKGIPGEWSSSDNRGNATRSRRNANGWMVDGKDQFNGGRGRPSTGLAGGRGGWPTRGQLIDGYRVGGRKKPTPEQFANVYGGLITQQKPVRRPYYRAPIAGQASEWGREQYRRSQQGNRRPPQRQGSGGWQVPDHLQGDLSHLPAHLRRYVEQRRGKSSGGGFMAGSNDFPEQREMRDQQRRKRQQLEDRRRQVQQRTPPGKQPAPPGMQWSISGWTGKWVLMPIGAMT